MGFITATTSNWFLIGPISVALGWIMNYIFEFLDLIGIPNIGLSIILFTIVIKAVMIPLSIKQQKFTKLQSIMQPELTAIQEKYKGKQDNASVMAQQQETKEVYGKYGVNPAGGCLQMLIQMPILFALYQVIYHMPGHITKLKNYYDGIATALMNISGYADNADFIALAEQNSITAKMVTNGALTDKAHIIDVLYKLTTKEWNQLFSIFNDSSLQSAYEMVASKIKFVNNFLGIDLSMKPTELLFSDGKIVFTCWWVVLIPILAGLLQWVSSKMMETQQPAKSGNGNDAGSMMKSMNIMMPLMSVVFCFMFEAGLGVYWVASAGVQCIIQLIVNKYMDRVNIDEMIEKNMEKVNKKRAKKGLPPKKAATVASSIHTIEEQNAREEAAKKANEEKAKASTEFYASTSKAKKGSLAEKAGMVQQYNERVKSMKGKNGQN